MIRTNYCLSILGLLTALLLGVAQVQSPTPQSLNCTDLPGAGSYSNPIRIGVISRTILIRDCPGLSSGSGFNVRYYSFDLEQTAPNGSMMGTIFTSASGAVSAVHPRLSAANGTTLLTSRRDGSWLEQGGWTMRYLNIAGLTPGQYRFGTEKLDSPLRSLQTPTFNMLIVLP
jgi:hypothetical protein